jgi:hypothetical protein
VLASAHGKIHFVLRNGSDTAQLETQPVELSQLIPDTDPKPAPVHRVRPHRPAPYVVETVMGDKRTMASFE